MSRDRKTLVPEATEKELLDPSEPATEGTPQPVGVLDIPAEAALEPPIPAAFEAAATETAAPAETTTPEPELPPDPFARARAALDAARAARGDDDDEPAPSYSSVRTDPLGRAEAALEAARSARGHGVSTTRKLEDAKVEAQLRRLKRALEDEG